MHLPFFFTCYLDAPYFCNYLSLPFAVFFEDTALIAKSRPIYITPCFIFSRMSLDALFVISPYRRAR